MKIARVLLAVVLSALGTFTACKAATEQPGSAAEFIEAALALPTFRDLYHQDKISVYYEPGSLTDKNEYARLKLVNINEFEKVMDKFFSVVAGELSNTQAWFDASVPLNELIDPISSTFVPYAQKLWIEPGHHLICKGDLHGDVHSLASFLKNLQEKGITSSKDAMKIIDPLYTIIFHGDYVDRGLWGVEVLYLLMLLKINNPNQVHLIRGNHEDPQIAQQYGFATEFHAKFQQEDQPEAVARCYHKLTRISIIIYRSYAMQVPEIMIQKTFFSCAMGELNWGIIQKNCCRHLR